MLLTTSLSLAAMNSMSCSLNPRVVTAAVPIRMPLVTNGERSSNGTMFLFSVMPARSMAASVSLPVTPLLCRSIA